MEFGNINEKFYIIIPIFFLLALFIGLNKRKKILKAIKIEEKRSIQYLKGILYLLALILIFIGLLSPQKLKDEKITQSKGLDFYVLIDTSNSMRGEDLYPNRLEMGKKVISEILSKLKGDRIGFIPFSDSAYIQMPLTEDYLIVNNYLEVIDTKLISGGGTDLISALKLANNSFIQSKTKKKIVVIISDGGEYNQKIVDFIGKNKLEIYSFAVGTAEGSIIPHEDEYGNIGFLKDESGETVVTRLNSELLKKISNLGYSEVTNSSLEVSKFIKELEKLERTNIKEEKTKNYQKYYQFFVFIGLVFIMIAFSLQGGLRFEKKD
jgi:Ca-activated chloride channel family protein